MLLAIYVPIFLTLTAGLGGVFLFRGQYYKSLAQRVDELEAKDHKSYEEIQRLRQENETLRRLVTGEMALEQLIELHRSHKNEADMRNQRLIELLQELRKMVAALNDK